MLIPINRHLFFDDSEVEESFIRASGPGGQNVNKVSSAVQLRFDLSRSRSLPEGVRERLARLAGRQLTPIPGSYPNRCSHNSPSPTRTDALTCPGTAARRPAGASRA